MSHDAGWYLASRKIGVPFHSELKEPHACHVTAPSGCFSACAEEEEPAGDKPP